MARARRALIVAFVGLVFTMASSAMGVVAQARVQESKTHRASCDHRDPACVWSVIAPRGMTRQEFKSTGTTSGRLQISPKTWIRVGIVRDNYGWDYTDGYALYACRQINGATECTKAADVTVFAKIRLNGRGIEWTQRITPYNLGPRTFHFQMGATCEDGNGSGVPTTSCGERTKPCNDPVYRTTKCGWGPGYPWPPLQDNDDYWVVFWYGAQVNCACWYDGLIWFVPNDVHDSFESAHFQCYDREISPCEF